MLKDRPEKRFSQAGKEEWQKKKHAIINFLDHQFGNGNVVKTSQARLNCQKLSTNWDNENLWPYYQRLQSPV